MAGSIAAGFRRAGRGQLGGLAAGLAVHTRHVGMPPDLELEAGKVAPGAANPLMNDLIRDATAGATQRLGGAVRCGPAADKRFSLSVATHLRVIRCLFEDKRHTACYHSRL